MQMITSITPAVCEAHFYSFQGSSSESARSSDVYALHLFEDSGSMRVDNQHIQVNRGTLIFLRPV